MERYIKFSIKRFDIFNFPQIDLSIQCNHNQKSTRFFAKNWQVGSKSYMKKQKTQKSQNNFEKKKQSWTIHNTLF